MLTTAHSSMTRHATNSLHTMSLTTRKITVKIVLSIIIKEIPL